MTVIYADTSAIVGAYLADLPGHDALRTMLFEGVEPVVTSEVARLEVASAAMAAERGGRIPNGRALLARFEADCVDGGPLLLVALRPQRILGRALELVREHPLGVLDAIHIAVALEEVRGFLAGEDLVLVTRDRRQAAAARALGFDVR